MKIIDGKNIAKAVKEDLKEKIAELKREKNKTVTLAVVMIGEDPASAVYVRNKVKAAEYVGIKSLSFSLSSDCSQSDAEEAVASLVKNEEVDAILVQLPLPKGLDADKLLSLIPPEKDVDGFTAANVGKLLLGEECSVACTPKGVITMLKAENVDLCGKHAVIVGRSNIVGKPLALLLLKENCTVTVCHSKTQNLTDICKSADILVAAIGKPCFIKGNMVKEGAIVVDVGINRTENGLVGDVDFERVKDKVSLITPVPGGVGPMTIASLMENAYDCAVRRVNK